ncbi:hypothetical protein LPU83_pLPU83c_0029 (plasmid) [Rhizobium favelukesii]|uniref:Uncharacterized protein n=1 Tax=Rhizobium favelukesii TaxID=348824 RepID=W6S2E9_9HYPH|nr:hypothetical protein LPU83_pLPU83c_0029 [Rhizobium favelukesii]
MLVRTAESSEYKTDLVTQARLGMFTALDSLLDENGVVERHEGVHYTSGGLRGIFNTKLVCGHPFANNRLDDHHDLVTMGSDDCPVLLRCCDDQIVDRLLFDERRFSFLVEDIQKIYELLVSRRLHPGDRICAPSSFREEAATDRPVDCRPRGKKTVDIGAAHSETGCNVGHRGLLVTDAAKVLFRHIQNPLPKEVDVNLYTGTAAHGVSSAKFLTNWRS